jgi:hypothetical protein
MKNSFRSGLNFKLRQPQRNLFVFSLLFMLIFSVLSVYMLTANAADPVYVGTETELRNAITNATGPTVIALNNDIQLTNTPLSITSGKDITLISSGTSVFFKLIGVSGTNTITINSGGVLELDTVYPKPAF